MSDAGAIGAWCSGIAGIIAAIGVLVKIVVSRPRMPVAEELLEQIDELRDDVLSLARWAHRAVARAAAGGVELDPPPEVLRSVGERAGERKSDPELHGWRSGVRVQTGEQPAVRLTSRGPDTRPDRRAQRPTPPPMRG